MLMSFYDPIAYKASCISKIASTVLMTDIFKNYKRVFDRVAINYKMVSYIIQDAPRPEKLSYDIYGNTQLYWVLLYANNIYDPFHGWIKSQQACYDSADLAYNGKAQETVVYHIDVTGVKHYNLFEGQTGIWYDKGDVNMQYPQFKGALVPVTASEAAILENEKKREIKIISKSDISSFVSDFLKELEKG